MLIFVVLGILLGTDGGTEDGTDEPRRTCGPLAFKKPSNECGDAFTKWLNEKARAQECWRHRTAECGQIELDVVLSCNNLKRQCN